MTPANLRRILGLSIIAATLFPVWHVSGQTVFEYRHQKDDQWRVNVTVVEEVLINGISVSSVEILNKIAVKVRQGDGESGLLWNQYSIAEKNRETGFYIWSEQYETVYGRQVDGQLYDVEENSPVPTVRNVPVFPDQPLQPGDSWQFGGQEVFNLHPTFQIPEILIIDFNVDYQYAGSEILDGRMLEILNIEYEYDWTLNPLNSSDARLMQEQWFPVAVAGEVQQTLWWDSELGRNYAADGDFAYTYFMNDGYEYTFRGRSEGKAIYSDLLDKDTLVQEIEELDDSDIRAQAVPQGVSLTLDNIHFMPDEATMLPGEETQLASIGEILRRYPKRDIMVVGHTANIPGRGDGQDLSERRAEAVASYLIDTGVRRDTQIIVKGAGNSEPLGDNNTEEGRRANRRVEIIILEFSTNITVPRAPDFGSE